MRTGGYLSLCIVLLVSIASSATGKVLHVGGAGSYTSIQAAIDDARPSGDEIRVAPGTYMETIDFKGKAIHLHSTGGPDVTIIDADWQDRVVYCDHGEGPRTILDGFTITHGDPYETAIQPGPHEDIYEGGGMYNRCSSPTVKNCVFTHNASSMTSGGGMWNGNASPTITDCDFVANHAHALGGDMGNSHSSPAIARCAFTDSSGNWAGSMYNTDSHPGNDAAAVSALKAFCKEVEARRGGKIPGADADALIAAAQGIIKLLTGA